MRAILSWPIMQACYLIGDFASTLMDWIDTERGAKLLYPVYNTLMLWSVDLNDWGGHSLWKNGMDHED